MPRLKGTNPKDQFGRLKAPMHLVPAVAIIHESLAMRSGEAKYGPFNWRKDRVSASVYIAAAQRHIAQYFDGEDFDAESGAHHLAHARACLGIILDAQSIDMLVDDRPHPGASAALIKSSTQKKKGIT